MVEIRETRPQRQAEVYELECFRCHRPIELPVSASGFD
jgi:hypothetical protein